MAFIEEPGRGLTLRCPWCGYEGQFQKKHIDVLSILICISLLLFGIVPGVVYALWYSQQEECPKCRAKVPRGPF